MRTCQAIESQINILEKLLESEPEKYTTGKWNPKHFSLLGKIKKLKLELNKQKAFEYLAQ